MIQSLMLFGPPLMHGVMGEATRIRKWSEKAAGVTFGIGLGFGLPGTEGWDNHFRIGHMGHQNLPRRFGGY